MAAWAGFGLFQSPNYQSHAMPPAVLVSLSLPTLSASAGVLIRHPTRAA